MSDQYARSEALNHAASLHEKAVGFGSLVDADQIVKDAETLLSFLQPAPENTDEKAPIGQTQHKVYENGVEIDHEAYRQEIAVAHQDRDAAVAALNEWRDNATRLQREVERLEVQARDKDLVRDALQQEVQERDDLIASLRLDVEMANQQAQNMRGLTMRVQADPVAPVTTTGMEASTPAEIEAEEAGYADQIQPAHTTPEPYKAPEPTLADQPVYQKGTEYDTGAVIHATTPFFWQDEEGKTGGQATASRDLMVGGDTPEGVRYFAAVRIR